MNGSDKKPINVAELCFEHFFSIIWLLNGKAPCSIMDWRVEEFRFLSAMKPEQKKQEDLISEFQLTFHWQQSSSRNKKRPASTRKTMAGKGFEGVEYFRFSSIEDGNAQLA